VTHSARGRIVAALEVVLFGASILTFIWWIQPLDRPALEAGFYVCILAFAFGSSLAHGDSRARLGIRLDTIAACARRVLVPTVVAIVVFIVIGRLTGNRTSPDWSRAPAAILRYTGWALLQQYALQNVVLLRLKDAGMTGRAPIAAALLFSLMHLPNGGLMLLTFAGGWVWCRAFDRAPNLLVIAVSHAVAALAADQWLPDAFIRGLRVGPGYFHRSH
jgi:membrane protease YdiL (CAAX protease family)